MNIIIENIKRKRQCHVTLGESLEMTRIATNNKGRFVLCPVLFFFILFSFFIASPSYAYLEEADDGSVKLSAGEQNTNMYRMTSKGKMALKKLKQIDEMMARGYAAGDGSAKNVREVTQIVDEQNDAAVRATAEQVRQTIRLLENKSSLQQMNSGQTVQMIAGISASQSRDSEIASALLQTLSRRRP
jgi:hypothetical protein